jgi:protein phosphatase
MILRAAASTDVGLRRKENEDRYALCPQLGLYLVADGMGGHSAGQVASELAAETALQAIQTLDGAAASLAEASGAAPTAIFGRRRSSRVRGYGDDLVAFWPTRRAALARRRQPSLPDPRTPDRQLTDDHSIVGSCCGA